MEKYACLKCIRGHRTSKCRHNDREVVKLRRKGRPCKKKGVEKAETGSDKGDKTFISMGKGSEYGDGCNVNRKNDFQSYNIISELDQMPYKGYMSMTLPAGQHCACCRHNSLYDGASGITDNSFDSSFSIPIIPRSNIAPAAQIPPQLCGCASSKTISEAVFSSSSNSSCHKQNIPLNHTSNSDISDWIASKSATATTHTSPTSIDDMNLYLNMDSTDSRTNNISSDTNPKYDCLFISNDYFYPSQLYQTQAEVYYKSACVNDPSQCTCASEEECLCIGCSAHPNNASTREARLKASMEYNEFELQ